MNPRRIFRKFSGAGGDLTDRPNVFHEPPVFFGPCEPLLQGQLCHGGTLSFFVAIINHRPDGVFPLKHFILKKP
jgi:hypothetical protein